MDGSGMDEAEMDSRGLMDTLLQLVAVPSITGSAGEAAMGRVICDLLLRMDYFRDRPGQVSLLPVAGDLGGRSAVCALLEGSSAGWLRPVPGTGTALR